MMLSDSTTQSQTDTDDCDTYPSVTSMELSDSMGIGRRLSLLASRVNVEPVIFLYWTAVTLGQGSMALFQFWGRCMQMTNASSFKSEVDHMEFCEHMAAARNKTGALQAVEADIAYYSIWVMLSGFMTVLVAPLFSSLSDKYGRRKLPLVFNLGVQTIYYLAMLSVIVLYPYINIWIPSCVANFISGCSGGPILFSGASMAMVTDMARASDHNMEQSSSVPLRIGVATALTVLASLVGNLIAFLLRSTVHLQEYFVGLLAAAVMVFFCFVYTILFVTETYPASQALELSSSVSELDSAAGNRLVSSLHNVRSAARGTFEVLREKRNGWRRYALNLTLLCLVVEVISAFANYGIMLLLVKSTAFDWSDQMFILFSIYVGLLNTVGTIFWPSIFALLQVAHQDSLMVLIGMAFLIGATLIYAFAKSTVMIYIAGSLAFFLAMIGPGFRSFIPKLVRKDETARVFMAFGLVITITPLISSPLFNTIYKYTVNTWTGWAFIVAAALQAIVFTAFLSVHLLMVRTRQQEAETYPEIGNERLLGDDDESD